MEAEVRDKVDSAGEYNCMRIGTVKEIVDRYMDKCGTRWAAMDTLFAKLGFGI